MSVIFWVIISIHPPRVGWDAGAMTVEKEGKDISIHPPRVGWDESCYDRGNLRKISIHPPRVGWDDQS